MWKQGRKNVLFVNKKNQKNFAPASRGRQSGFYVEIMTAISSAVTGWLK
jgi:hypothetical protein